MTFERVWRVRKRYDHIDAEIRPLGSGWELRISRNGCDSKSNGISIHLIVSHGRVAPPRDRAYRQSRPTLSLRGALFATKQSRSPTATIQSAIAAPCHCEELGLGRSNLVIQLPTTIQSAIA